MKNHNTLYRIALSTLIVFSHVYGMNLGDSVLNLGQVKSQNSTNATDWMTQKIILNNNTFPSHTDVMQSTIPSADKNSDIKTIIKNDDYVDDELTKNKAKLLAHINRLEQHHKQANNKKFSSIENFAFNKKIKKTINNINKEINVLINIIQTKDSSTHFYKRYQRVEFLENIKKTINDNPMPLDSNDINQLKNIYTVTKKNLIDIASGQSLESSAAQLEKLGEETNLKNKYITIKKELNDKIKSQLNITLEDWSNYLAAQINYQMSIPAKQQSSRDNIIKKIEQTKKIIASKREQLEVKNLVAKQKEIVKQTKSLEDYIKYEELLNNYVSILPNEHMKIAPQETLQRVQEHIKIIIDNSKEKQEQIRLDLEKEMRLQQEENERIEREKQQTEFNKRSREITQDIVQKINQKTITLENIDPINNIVTKEDHIKIFDAINSIQSFDYLLSILANDALIENLGINFIPNESYLKLLQNLSRLKIDFIVNSGEKVFFNHWLTTVQKLQHVLEKHTYYELFTELKICKDEALEVTNKIIQSFTVPDGEYYHNSISDITKLVNDIFADALNNENSPLRPYYNQVKEALNRKIQVEEVLNKKIMLTTNNTNNNQQNSINNHSKDEQEQRRLEIEKEKQLQQERIERLELAEQQKLEKERLEFEKQKAQEEAEAQHKREQERIEKEKQLQQQSTQITQDILQKIEQKTAIILSENIDAIIDAINNRVTMEDYGKIFKALNDIQSFDYLLSILAQDKSVFDLNKNTNWHILIHSMLARLTSMSLNSVNQDNIFQCLIDINRIIKKLDSTTEICKQLIKRKEELKTKLISYCTGITHSGSTTSYHETRFTQIGNDLPLFINNKLEELDRLEKESIINAVTGKQTNRTNNSNNQQNNNNNTNNNQQNSNNNNSAITNNNNNSNNSTIELKKDPNQWGTTKLTQTQLDEIQKKQIELEKSRQQNGTQLLSTNNDNNKKQSFISNHPYITFAAGSIAAITTFIIMLKKFDYLPINITEFINNLTNLLTQRFAH